MEFYCTYFAIFGKQGPEVERRIRGVLEKLASGGSSAGRDGEVSLCVLWWEAGRRGTARHERRLRAVRLADPPLGLSAAGAMGSVPWWPFSLQIICPGGPRPRLILRTRYENPAPEKVAQLRERHGPGPSGP